MSEEDAFLDGIAADRADRPRLLVFADWLADRSDPREEFVRLHAKLLEMDGTEPEFVELESKWTEWTRKPIGHTPGARLSSRWSDALYGVCTMASVEAYRRTLRESRPVVVRRWRYGESDFVPRFFVTSSRRAVTLYHGLAADFESPFHFVTATVVTDLREDPFQKTNPLDACHPSTRGRFWLLWRGICGDLRVPPAPPPRVTVPDNTFLGSESILIAWNHTAYVAIHRHDYFAIFWSTTA
jgi:uncharacterized protein (TIGR02996 family)